MLKSFINTERQLRRIFDEVQLNDYSKFLEKSFNERKNDQNAILVRLFYLTTPILDSYIYQIEKNFGEGILDIED